MNSVSTPLGIAEKGVSSFEKMGLNRICPVWQRKTPLFLPFYWFSPAYSLKEKLTLVVIVSMLLSILAMFLFPAGSLYAQGLGLTGNFYSCIFELAPGETSAGIEAYVIIINKDIASMRVKIDTQIPQGVSIALPETDFVLEAAGHKRLDAVVEVGKNAVPGEYKIVISATPFREGEGIKISGGGAQRATLKVLKSGISPLVLAVIVVGCLLVLAGVVWLLVIRHRRNVFRRVG